MSSTELSCNLCGKAYKTLRNYEKHLSEKHETGAGTSNITIKTEKVKSEYLYTCHICDKQYKAKKWYDNHLLKHAQAVDEHVLIEVTNANQLNPTVAEEDGDYDDSELLPEEAIDDYEEMISYYELEDEEQEALLLASLTGVPVPVRKGAAAQAAKTPLALCSTCGKEYRTIAGFLKHRISHAMAEATAQAPSFDCLKEESKRLSEEVLKDILASYPSETKNLRLCSSKMQENIESDDTLRFLTSLCVGLYACFTNGTVFLLPSHLREVYLRGVAVLVANKEKREELLLKLKSVLAISDDSVNINFFLSTFMRNFSNKVLAFIVHWMVHGSNSPIVRSASKFRQSRESIDTEDFKQTIHYIGGANVKSVLRSAWRKWGSNDECKAVIKTLRENFLVQNDLQMEDKDFMSWTLTQDRGKLIKINEEAWNFFMELAAIAKPLERHDGSLYVEDVIEQFSTHAKILYMWETLVQETLPQKASFRLLYSLTTYFCNTYRSGILSRRMDDIQTRNKLQPLGTGGVSFRPQVVRFS